MTIVNGPTVLLRPWRLDDVPFVTDACGDPDICQWTTVASAYTRADTLEWVGELAPQLWSDGQAALETLATWSFRERALMRLELHADVENTASRRVAENTGFSFEGILRSYALRHGEHRDYALYAHLAAD